MKRTNRLLLSLVIGLGVMSFLLFLSRSSASGGSGLAPEFPDGREWLNVKRPLKLSELRGKIVLLDFWTYCCINCMHVIPDLKKLEAKYRNELVVVGVHSAKFDTERGTENIREAILRYGIEHPVINDQDFAVWKSYGARGWPTFVLIDLAGRIVGTISGEGVYQAFDATIGKLVSENQGKFSKLEIPILLEREKTKSSFLAFPGKILADAGSKRLFVVDSNHHRVVISDLAGRVLDVIGSGKQGANDGSFDEASFFQPQGVALRLIGNTEELFIADTENHLIRKADLKARTVTTIAGTGKQEYARAGGGPARVSGLNSPWDLVLVGNKLFIAMAGSHQLWVIDLETSTISVHAGSGAENITDGKLLKSELAQPSGITSDGERLYFADSEVSAIRIADVSSTGQVKTIIGKGLFDFGDVDGDSSTARLQHPLGIVFHGGKLFVADTYNSKVKIIDPLSRSAKTLAGSKAAGLVNGKFNEASFNEPAGIAYAAGKLYLADTNNHAVRVLDLTTETVSTLEFTMEVSSDKESS